MAAFNLHKIPGCYVVAFHGIFGSGKTLSMLEHSIRLADATKKSLVYNFKVDSKYLRIYARRHRLNFVANYARIIYEPDVSKLLHYESKILVMDEAGVDLFSRDWKKSNKDLFDRLFRIRHYRNYLLYASQASSQIDKQFRDMAQLIIACNGLQRYSSKLGHSRLMIQYSLAYDKLQFDLIEANHALKGKIIYPIWKSGFRVLLRFPTIEEIFYKIQGKKPDFDLLFASYNSFDSRKRQAEKGVRIPCWVEWPRDKVSDNIINHQRRKKAS